MKFAIVFLSFFLSLALAEVEVSFKVSGRNIFRDYGQPPKTKVSVEMRYSGYYGGFVDSFYVEATYDPDWTKEFFFVHPEGVNPTFEVRVEARIENTSSPWTKHIGSQEFKADQLSENGVVIKRLIPDNSMQIIVSKSEPNQPTCKANIVC